MTPQYLKLGAALFAWLWLVPAGADPAGKLARPWAEAESLFRQDPLWLGSDGAISAPLGGDRLFFSFDDSFIATTTAHSRRESVMVRNSIAVLEGLDPLTGKMSFHWGRSDDGNPTAFFSGDGDAWYWTGDAVRLDAGPLAVFLARMIATPGEGLGFATAGHALALVEDPDQPPEAWTTVIHQGPPQRFGVTPGSALVNSGAHVIALAIRETGVHAGTLVRYRQEDLAVGNLANPDWWSGQNTGWIPADQLDESGPVFVIANAGAESSIHFDRHIDAWAHFASYGFGAATIGMRTAPALTGPWSAVTTVYHPPELDWPRPFIYAAMAHPELATPGAGEVLVTYATNAFGFDELFIDRGQQNIYWPRVISVRMKE